MMAPVQFGEEGDKKADFVIEAYTGQAVDRWWGKLSIAVDGIKAKNKIPIFRGHEQSSVVGFSNKTWKDGSFFVSGKFSTVTQHAKEVKELAAEGFPWQASIGVRPLKILEIERGATHEVNGKKLKGPGEVWLESEVFETSFVPLGADDDTSISIFSKIEEVENPKPAGKPAKKKEIEPMEITLAMIEADHSDIAKALMDEGKVLGVAEGVQAETARVRAVMEMAMPGHDMLLLECMLDGKTTGPEAAIRILQAERAIRDGARANLVADGVKPVPTGAPADIETGELDQSLPIEDLAKAEWEKDKGLKTEFNNDYAAYLAFRIAEHGGHVKFLTNKKGGK